MNAARKVALCDRYSKFADDFLVKENLHAKIYLAVDFKGIPKCLTGSVNLTRQAFFERAELGVFTSDSLIIQQIDQIISIWRSSAPKPKEYRVWRKEFLDKYPPVRKLIESGVMSRELARSS